MSALSYQVQPNLQRRLYAVWYAKFTDPQGYGLWIRFTFLATSNQFRQVAECWAIFFQRSPNGDVVKTAFKQSQDLKTFFNSPQTDGIQMGECQLTSHQCKGRLQSQGRTIQWNLQMTPAQDLQFNLVPESLSRSGMIKTQIMTLGEDLRATGFVEVDGKKFLFEKSSAMQGRISGPRTGYSWAWGHCNFFVNERQEPTPIVFEGLSARARLTGPLISPQLSSFFFFYEGQAYHFNTLWSSIRIRSKSNLTAWNFQADRGELSFRGHIQAEYRDFAGLIYEDTDGSLLYCHGSNLCHMTLLIYRNGKLESTLTSPGTTSFETVTRTKNPYVPMLI